MAHMQPSLGLIFEDEVATTCTTVSTNSHLDRRWVRLTSFLLNFLARKAWPSLQYHNFWRERGREDVGLSRSQTCYVATNDFLHPPSPLHVLGSQANWHAHTCQILTGISVSSFYSIIHMRMVLDFIAKISFFWSVGSYYDYNEYHSLLPVLETGRDLAIGFYHARLCVCPCSLVL
jgi:hypothetical protein